MIPAVRGSGRGAIDEREPAATGRGQANLAALAASVVVLVAVTVAGVAVAEGALVTADREPLDRRAAATLADRLLAADETTVRTGVLNRSAVENLSAGDVDRLAPPVAGRPVRIELDGRSVVERGDPDGGVTVRRAALVGGRDSLTETAPLSTGTTVRERTDRLTVDLDPAENTTVEAVRVDGRIVLESSSGLDGRHRVPVSRYANATVTFDLGGGENGSVELIARPINASGAELAVVVGE